MGCKRKRRETTCLSLVKERDYITKNRKENKHKRRRGSIFLSFRIQLGRFSNCKRSRWGKQDGRRWGATRTHALHACERAQGHWAHSGCVASRIQCVFTPVTTTRPLSLWCGPSQKGKGKEITLHQARSVSSPSLLVVVAAGE